MSVSITIHYECDECGDWEEYDSPDILTEEEIREHIESEEWEFRNGQLLCPDCASEDDDEDAEIKPFLDRCFDCIRSIGQGLGEAPYCPHYKQKCDTLAYSMDECPNFQPIGGKKEKGQKYKPVDNCSLEGFVEGIH